MLAKIKETYKNAHFVHCYAHQLNLLMQRATNIISKVRISFANLSAIPAFFLSSTHRGDVLEEIVSKRLPRVCATRSNYNIHTVNIIVYENLEILIACFKELESS